MPRCATSSDFLHATVAHRRTKRLVEMFFVNAKKKREWNIPWDRSATDANRRSHYLLSGLLFLGSPELMANDSTSRSIFGAWAHVPLLRQQPLVLCRDQRNPAMRYYVSVLRGAKRKRNPIRRQWYFAYFFLIRLSHWLWLTPICHVLLTLCFSSNTYWQSTGGIERALCNNMYIEICFGVGYNTVSKITTSEVEKKKKPDRQSSPLHADIKKFRNT